MKDLIEQKKILLSLYEKIKEVDKGEKQKYRELIKKAKAPLDNWIEDTIRKIQIEEINPLIKSGEKKSYFNFHYDIDMITIDKNHKDYKEETDKKIHDGVAEGVYKQFPTCFIFSLLTGEKDFYYDEIEYSKESFNSDLKKTAYFVFERFYQLSIDLLEEGKSKGRGIFRNDNYSIVVMFEELEDDSKINIIFQLKDIKSGFFATHSIREDRHSFFKNTESIGFYHFVTDEELQEHLDEKRRYDEYQSRQNDKYTEWLNEGKEYDSFEEKDDRIGWNWDDRSEDD